MEVTRVMLDRIEKFDSTYGGYVAVVSERALARAEIAEQEIRSGMWRGPLHGVPLALKDLCATTFAPTAAGMPMRRAFIPSQDATVVQRLEQAGAVILGKTTMTEGAFAEYRSEFPQPINPWNADYWPGTSSGGSAVATAAALCYGAIGSDTGGSIRYPAACCGVTGVKPTWGRVSRCGVVPLADTLDHVGPIARTAADCAILLGVLAGADSGDPSTLPQSPVPDYHAGISDSIHDIRIGFDAAYATACVASDVVAAVDMTLRTLRESGARVVEVSIPSPSEAIEAWLPICAAEAAIAHEKTFESHATQYGQALTGLIQLGRSVQPDDMARYAAVRRDFVLGLAQTFTEIDVLLTPVLTGNVPSLAEIAAAMADVGTILRFTAPFNLTGYPTITIPAAFDEAGLPVAVQLAGRPLEEGLLLRVAHAFQQRTDWHMRRPVVG